MADNQLTLIESTETRIYWVEFKHEYFGWLDTDYEFTTLQGAMDRVHTSRSAYPQRVVSQSISGHDRRVDYRDPKPRRSR